MVTLMICWTSSSSVVLGYPECRGFGMTLLSHMFIAFLNTLAFLVQNFKWPSVSETKFMKRSACLESACSQSVTKKRCQSVDPVVSLLTVLFRLVLVIDRQQFLAPLQSH